MAKNTRKQRNETIVDKASGVKCKVGEVCKNVPVEEIRTRGVGGPRSGVMVRLHDGLAFLSESQLPELDRPDREKMMQEVEIGWTFDVVVTEIDLSGYLPKVYVSALKLLQDAADKQRQVEQGQREERIRRGYACLEALQQAVTHKAVVQGVVRELKGTDVLLTLDEFHTGILSQKDQVDEQTRPNELVVGDTVEVVVRRINGSGRDARIVVSETDASAKRMQAAEEERRRKAAETQAQANTDVLANAGSDKQYRALTTGFGTAGFSVRIEGTTITATMPVANLLDPAKSKSVSARGQNLYVGIVSVSDGAQPTDPKVVVVKQVKRK